MNNKPLTILTFPVWWYTEGLQLAFRRAGERCRYVLRSTGLLIFVRNMTQPLYGDITRSGRIISFFLRIFILLALVIWTLARFGFVFVLLFLHIAALPVAVVMSVYQLFSLFI